MNLLSLPDEMAANVLKYASYATINRMRKMSSRINNIAKSFDIGIRFPVTSICFINSSRFDQANFLPGLVLDMDENAVKCHPILSENNLSDFAMQLVEVDNFLLESIDKILRKVELNGTLHFATRHLLFDDAILELFSKDQKTFRRMSTFRLLDSIVRCTENPMRHFITSVKKLRVYQIQHCDAKTDVLFQAKVGTDC